MDFFVPHEDVARELAGRPVEFMEILAELAEDELSKSLIEDLAAAHNGTPSHCAILTWLSRLIVALGQVESADAAIDAAGFVS